MGMAPRPPALQVDSVPCELPVEADIFPCLETERMAHPIAFCDPHGDLWFPPQNFRS